IAPSEGYSALIGEQFANCSKATAAKVIDIVERPFAAAEVDQVFDRRDEIFVRQNAFGKIDIDPELLIDFVTANATEIVFLRIEEQSLQQSTRVGHGRRVPRAQSAVNIF